jgi:hypothetical protein
VRPVSLSRDIRIESSVGFYHAILAFENHNPASLRLTSGEKLRARNFHAYLSLTYLEVVCAITLTVFLILRAKASVAEVSLME